MRKINPYQLWTGAFVPNWLLSRDEVSHGAKLVYARLAQLTAEKGYAEPTRELLAVDIGTSTRQLDRYLTELSDHTLIQVERVGKKNPNKYWFLTHVWMQAPIPGGQTNVSIQLPVPFTDYEREFELEFYPEYPRKKNPRTAKAAYLKARKRGASKEDIIAGLSDLLRYIEVTGKEIQYIPHPTSWLNADGWTNDYIKEIEDAERTRSSTDDERRSDAKDRLIAATRTNVH